MNTLAVVPARLGSVRLPRKNLLEIEPGKCLIQHAVDCAVDSGLVDHVVVSTDDPARCAHIRHAQIVPRPPDLCEADADISAAILHAWHTQGAKHDLVVTLQPAVLARSPLIVRTLLDACRYRPACGLTLAHTAPWHWRLDRTASHPQHRRPGWIGSILGEGDGYERSQDAPDTYAEINAVQVATAEAVAAGKRWAYPLRVATLPAWAAALDIDHPNDLATARQLWPVVRPMLETWQPQILNVDHAPC